MPNDNQDDTQSSKLPRNVGEKTRRAAVYAFRAVIEKKIQLDVAIDDACFDNGLNTRDRAFVQQLVTTSLRRYGCLSRLLEEFVERSLPDNTKSIQAILILGLAQILFMRTSDHAAVNESVNLLGRNHERYRGLVNAVLRRCVREREEWLEVIENSPGTDIPAWLYISWEQAYGDEVLFDIGKSLRDEPKLDITVKDPARTAELAELLEAEVMTTGSLRRDLCDVSQLPEFHDGSWWVQDMAAALPATLLPDISGKTVVDFCAAPGGKTMQLAAMGADVIAVDRSKTRIKRVHENLSRTQLKAEVIVGDALNLQLPRAVDHILLDAPCSATGTLRSNPDVMWSKKPADVKKLTSLQALLLTHAFDLLPVGGTLIYCVCSLEPSEGIDQVTAFLSITSNAERVDITADEVGGLDILIKDGDMLCLPSYMLDQGGMDGFYAARITKTK